MARSVAASTWRNCPAETRPNGPFPTRRVFEIVRICSHFTNVVSRRPLLFAGSILTWKGTRLPFVLMASTMVFGWREFVLPASFWITRAGRLPACSEPRAGLKSTYQISPRRGEGYSDIQQRFDLSFEKAFDV